MSSASEAGGPRSLWRATAAQKPLELDPLDCATRADAVVVGGGLCGLSAALHLAERGLDTVVLESHSIGHGASGRNGGQVNPGCKLSRAALERRFGDAGGRFHALCESGPDFLARLIEERRIDCGFTRPGTLRLAHSPRSLEAVAEAARDLETRGIEARYLDRGAAAALVGSDAYRGGLVDPRGGSLHPLDFTRGLARAATAAGARVHERSPATGMRRKNGHWLIDMPTGQVEAEHVVIATNAYTGALTPRLSRSLLPVNSFQVATAQLPEDVAAPILPEGHAAYDSRRLILYFRKTHDNRLVLGGRASFSSRLGEGAGTPDYSVLENVLLGIFPAIRGVGFEYRWTGLVCITPDFLPHYHNPLPGQHMLLGFNGRGVAAAVVAGAWLGGEIAGEPSADTGIPPTPVRPIPFHAMRAPALNLAMQWGRALDRLGL